MFDAATVYRQTSKSRHRRLAELSPISSNCSRSSARPRERQTDKIRKKERKNESGDERWNLNLAPASAGFCGSTKSRWGSVPLNEGLSSEEPRLSLCFLDALFFFPSWMFKPAAVPLPLASAETARRLVLHFCSLSHFITLSEEQLDSEERARFPHFHKEDFLRGE